VPNQPGTNFRPAVLARIIHWTGAGVARQRQVGEGGGRIGFGVLALKTAEILDEPRPRVAWRAEREWMGERATRSGSCSSGGDSAQGARDRDEDGGHREGGRQLEREATDALSDEGRHFEQEQS
jgi:hypothetical protein